MKPYMQCAEQNSSGICIVAQGLVLGLNCCVKLEIPLPKHVPETICCCNSLDNLNVPHANNQQNKCILLRFQ